MSRDSFNCRQKLVVGSSQYTYYDLNVAAANGAGSIERMPRSLKVLFENLLRFEDGVSVSKDDIKTLGRCVDKPPGEKDIAYRPARVLMQDFTGVPAVADLAAMRESTVQAGLNPDIINPIAPVDLVIDHSVMVDHFGDDLAFDANVEKEMARNRERYRFLRWGQQTFNNFRVVPPGTGICHQVNLEYLSKVVWTKEENGEITAYPDTLVGTDSHTTMVNGLGVLGWGVGGIEAEAAMLGQPISMLIPEVVGVRLSGKLRDGITGTDLVLRVVEILREQGVVGKFVEFFGPALDYLSLADRATIANMAPEYGATCGFFPVDEETIRYLKLTSRPAESIELAESYARTQGLWRDEDNEPQFSVTLEVDLNTIEPSLAGPKRPQDRVRLANVPTAFESALIQAKQDTLENSVKVGEDYELNHGDVVIAAITSCTNTSNPAVMLGAGLVAQKALERGLQVKPWVKTSFAPGSKVVTEYMNRTGLQESLDAIGFNLVGYGCTTCIGNSGPLPEDISNAIAEGELVVASVLSGNRNFEGRVHQEVKTNWLASPPLVVAYALAGSVKIDLDNEPLGQGNQNEDVYLRDIWPSSEEVSQVVNQISAGMFSSQYADVFSGTKAWQEVRVDTSGTYSWDESTYIKQPPFFQA
ncbi:MAG: aconitate hydratase AcnA, partial [Gammaproteobacteria bacterium]|nr:aconitate hydratase AcnA [Gammaproteobacteria bacterium]